MRRLTIALLLVAANLLAGCGPAYHGMPPRTLQKDEVYYGVGVTWNALEPLFDWHGFALNGHVWWSVSDRDALGVNFSSSDLLFFFPEFSYAHSWAPDRDGRRVVGSAHASLALNWSPGLEAGLGVSRARGRFAHLAWAGAGLWRDGTVTPSLRYVAQTGELRGEVGWMPGRMATALRLVRDRYHPRPEQGSFELIHDENAAWEYMRRHPLLYPVPWNAGFIEQTLDRRDRWWRDLAVGAWWARYELVD